MRAAPRGPGGAGLITPSGERDRKDRSSRAEGTGPDRSPPRWGQIARTCQEYIFQVLTLDTERSSRTLWNDLDLLPLALRPPRRARLVRNPRHTGTSARPYRPEPEQPWPASFGPSANVASPCRAPAPRWSVWCVGVMARSSGDLDPDDEMRRLTIRLSAPGHRALKEASARQGRSTGAVIEESLRLGGAQPIDTARELVARAQARPDPDDATAVAVRETRLRGGGR